MPPLQKSRQSLRLRHYDYTQNGAYFMTICTKNRECLFGEIRDGRMILNGAGRMIQTVWDEIPWHYTGIQIDEFIVMPNHIHGILWITNPPIVGAGPRACPHHDQSRKPGQPQGVAPTLSLRDVVHRFKSMTTKRYSDGVKQNAWPHSQKNYGIAIITNTSFAMKPRFMKFAATFKIIRWIGIRIRRKLNSTTLLNQADVCWFA